MDKKEQYIYKDGRYLKISSFGGSDVDVEVVTELPETAPEGTTFYLVEDGDTPSPSGHDKTKRAPVLMPYFPFTSNDKRAHGSYGKTYFTWSGHLAIGADSFLTNYLLFGEGKQFDFENHNYWWAYGNGVSSTAHYLWRQNNFGIYPYPDELKKCRKHYSGQLTEVPTWTTLLTELFGSDFVNYIDTAGDVYIWEHDGCSGNQTVGDKYRKGHWWSYRKSWLPSRRLKISIPLKSDNFGDACIAFAASDKISMTSNKRNKLAQGTLTGQGCEASGKCNIYLVKDVTCFERSNETNQYIPGDIMFRFAICKIALCNEQPYCDENGVYFENGFSKIIRDQKSLTITVDCDLLPWFYFPSGPGGGNRANFRLPHLYLKYLRDN